MIFWEKRDYYYCTCPLSFEHKYFVLRRKKWAGSKQDSVLSPFPPPSPFVEHWKPAELPCGRTCQPAVHCQISGWEASTAFFFFSLISSEKKCQGTVRVQFFPGFCFSFFLSFFLSIFLLLLLLLYISFHSKER